VNLNMTKPCPKCPFRYDIPGYLTEERVYEITDSLRSDASFTCHETTVESEEDEEGFTDMLDGPKAEHCAGALIWMERNEEPNQLMRIFERFGGYDRTKLDMDSPVFDCEHDMASHHGKVQ